MIRLMIVLLSIMAFCLGGCETVKGVGKDMQKAGNWIEDKAGK